MLKIHIIDLNKVIYRELEGCSQEYKQGYLDAIDEINKAPTIIEDIRNMQIRPTEIIVLFYNMNNLNCKEIENVFRLIRFKFTNNNVIALPDKTSLKSCSKDVLENYIGMISGFLEKL